MFVDGDEIANGAAVWCDNTTVKAVPKSGHYFIGWVDAAGVVLSTEAEYSPSFGAAEASLTALFADVPLALWDVDGKVYADWDVALEKAATSKKITLANNGTLLEGEYSIPSGYTLLIPFDDSGKLYTTKPDSVNE